MSFLTKLIGGISHSAENVAQAAPASFNQFLDAGKSQNQNLPTQLNRVIGNAVVQNAADKFHYTPAFKNLIPQTNVSLMGVSPSGYAGETDFGNRNTNNRQGANINLYNDSGGNDPYMATHELLHYADSRKTPQAQQHFAGIAQQNNTPRFKGFLSNLLSNEYAPVTPQTDYRSLPFDLATEVHSYSPLDPNAAPAIKQYYGRYFDQSLVGQYDKSRRGGN